MNNLDIISRAMRRIGVLSGGAVPRSQESADALETLRGIYRRLISEGVSGPLADIVPTTTTYTAQENQRIFRNSEVTTSITLPDTVMECGKPRLPRDASVISITDEFSNSTDTFIYETETRTWVNLDNLTLSSPALFARRDPIGLSCYLAVELSDEYGQQPSDTTKFNAARFQMTLTTNWSAPETVQHQRDIYF